MSDRSTIEWTDATWNPITGCTKVSSGCDHCYAESLAERFRGTPGHHFENGFDLQLRPEKLDQPLRWKKPRRIFVNSMSDLFHDQVPDEYIARVFAVMALAPRHTFQVLTKRHGRMRSLLSSDEFRGDVLQYIVNWIIKRRLPDDHLAEAQPDWWPLSNVWLGVSAEDQKWADIRWPALRETSAAVRFVSFEPLLGPILLCQCDGAVYGVRRHPFLTNGDCPLHGITQLDWAIVGGESGRGARPMDLDWARSVRDQCVSEGIAFHYKQQGTHGGTPKSERTLDGRIWDEFPRTRLRAPGSPGGV